MMGDITVYFLHDTVTPDNTRMVWRHAEAVPRKGDEVNVDFITKERPTVCTVTRVRWLTRTAVEVYLTTAVSK
jgi:hypothetical protein